MSDHNDWLGGNESGVIKNKKTYFSILAHINEQALAAQIENIRHFNPDAGIIVYNGGTDPNFGRHLNVLIYPYSHPIRHGNLTPYFWEIMKWLEETNVDYEYLINLDHDVLFIKHGFQEYLDKLMKNHDVMGWDMVTSLSPADTDLSCCHDMWKEWGTWGPFFETEYFIRYLNPTQVYRHGIVRKMLEYADHQTVEDMIANPRVFALEEMFFVTLVLSIGGRIREYPREKNWNSAARFGHEQISLDELRLVKQHPYYYWIHPVKEAWLIRMNQWLLGEQNGDPKMDEPAPLIESPASVLESPVDTSLPAPSPSPVIPFHKKKKLFRNKQRKIYMKKTVNRERPLKKKKKPVKKTNRLSLKRKQRAASISSSRFKKRIWRIAEVEVKP